MKYAYLILTHKHPDQFIRLVRSLDTRESLFIIHIDKKADPAEFKKVENWVDKSKITWLPSKSIVWAGYNSIRVTLNGLKAAARLKENISHITFISGQDYPIKPIVEYHKFLSKNEKVSFMEYSMLPRPNWANGGMDRIHYYHILFPSFRLAFPLVSYLKIKLKFNDDPKWAILKKVIRLIPASKPFPRKFLAGYTPYEGSNWFTFSMNLVGDILGNLEQNPAFYSYLKFTHHPDEIFFQTLVLNKLPHQIPYLQNKNMVQVEWDKTTGRPFDLTMQNSKMLQSSEKYFARKFEPTISKEILAFIDKELLAH